MTDPVFDLVFSNDLKTTWVDGVDISGKKVPLKFPEGIFIGNYSVQISNISQYSSNLLRSSSGEHTTEIITGPFVVYTICINDTVLWYLEKDQHTILSGISASPLGICPDNIIYFLGIPFSFMKCSGYTKEKIVELLKEAKQRNIIDSYYPQNSKGFYNYQMYYRGNVRELAKLLRE